MATAQPIVEDVGSVAAGDDALKEGRAMVRVLLMLAVVLATAVAARADEKETCTNQTIRGSYGFTVTGTIKGTGGAPDQLVVGVATTVFDGQGNLTQADTIHVSLAGTFAGTGFGTYQLDPDCSGTVTISETGVPPFTLRIVVVDDGNEIRTAVIDPPANMVTSNGRRTTSRR